MAPFVDVNHDGIYNPLQGDYPATKGDQALWWVFSDNGPTHNETSGQPLKVEVHAMAYAYNRGGIINNAVYYEYSVTNKSTYTYNNFRIGQYMDPDLGYPFDDLIGFDSTHRMGICYNGIPVDGNGQTNSYGNMTPTIGLSMLYAPGDIAPSSYLPAGDFMYSLNINANNPLRAGQYDNNLRAKLLDSTHLKNDQNIDCNYFCPSDPSNRAQWSECNGGLPGDRRFILSSCDITFSAGSTQKIVLALIATNPMLNNGCPSTSFDSIKTYADTVWAIYQHPYPSAGVNNVPGSNTLNIYPNPAHDKMFINNLPHDAMIVVCNILGQRMHVSISADQNITTIDVGTLPPGVYNILYSTSDTYATSRFIKN